MRLTAKSQRPSPSPLRGLNGEAKLRSGGGGGVAAFEMKLALDDLHPTLALPIKGRDGLLQRRRSALRLYSGAVSIMEGRWLHREYQRDKAGCALRQSGRS
jgi:hypothetical protein